MSAKPRHRRPMAPAAALVFVAPTDADVHAALSDVGVVDQHPESMRLPLALRHRVDRLLPLLADDSVLGGAVMRWSRSAVMRVAVLVGVAVLERRLGLPSTAPPACSHDQIHDRMTTTDTPQQ